MPTPPQSTWMVGQAHLCPLHHNHLCCAAQARYRTPSTAAGEWQEYEVVGSEVMPSSFLPPATMCSKCRERKTKNQKLFKKPLSFSWKIRHKVLDLISHRIKSQNFAFKFKAVPLTLLGWTALLTHEVRIVLDGERGRIYSKYIVLGSFISIRHS